MKKIEMTETIMAAKSQSGLGWEEIAAKVGLAPVFLTSACLGMNSLKLEYANKLCEVLGLPSEISEALQQFPHKSYGIRLCPQIRLSIAGMRLSGSTVRPSRS